MLELALDNEKSCISGSGSSSLRFGSFEPLTSWSRVALEPLGLFTSLAIVEHLKGLRSPWNCPHGRPTMRHLVDLRTLRKRSDKDDIVL
ncbi:putative mutL domain, dimerization subdomain-containing protein [Helianthus annuus]|nr:putative mutL domain, dimerization subdomain-containing protein [Helianthus annuus]